MEIKSKHSKGDVVFGADTTYKTKNIGCPDCLGTKKWVVVFADGEAVEVDCQTCKVGYEPPCGVIEIREWNPSVERLTVGTVRFDDNATEKFSYMCEETGVGSGRVYYEKDLFETRDKALERAKEKHEEQMKSIAKSNFSKKFGGTKEIERALSTWGFSRRMTIEKVQIFRKWAGLSKVVKEE